MPTSTEELVRQINAQHTEIMAALKAENAELAERIKTHTSQIAELAQRAERSNAGGGQHAAQSGWIGHAVANSAELADFQKRQHGRGRVSIKIENVVTTAAAGGLIPSDVRVNEPALLGRNRLTVRALCAPGRTTTGLVQYPRQTGFTNNARSVSEGVTKPESSVTYEMVDAPVRTVAHFIVASRQALDDAPQLETLIDGDLRYGLAQEEEVQLLLGDGSGESLVGIIPQATSYSPPFTVAHHQRLDEILLAIAQAQAAKYPATGILVNDIDLLQMQSIKDSQGRYLGAGPFGPALGLMWQLPAIGSPNMPAGHFLVGAFGLAAQIWDRLEAEVLISTEDSDNFRRNLATLRGEERLAFGVKRPEAFVYGQFTTPSA
jgi:HK97 family phage major capsid protein